MRARFTRGLYHFPFLNSQHFFAVWRHSFDVAWFIFKKELFSRAGKPCVRTVNVLSLHMMIRALADTLQLRLL